MPDPAIFTVGHSSHSEEAFLDLLRLHGVEAVVDVRSVPYSRRQPQFNREAISRALKAAGIAYAFLGRELGARSDDPSCYEAGRVQYRRLAESGAFRRGLEQVLAGGKKRVVALMCAEGDPLECHRAVLVSRELEAAGARVAHIHPDGHIEDHADAMKRLLNVLKLPERDMFTGPDEMIEQAYRKQEERIAYAVPAAAAAEAEQP